MKISLFLFRPFRPLKGIPGQNSQTQRKGQTLHLYQVLVAPLGDGRGGRLH
jgi:hypothetical protein